MKVYYNDFSPSACAWLRQLITDGLIPDGVVDQRSIKDIQIDDLDGFDQCHFFAGIGGWACALQLAGWDQPCWTGSCPCQPFSLAGKRKGTSDERHLWPEFLRLIALGKPPVVFGEQVASKDGRLWLSGVRSDLEGVGYAVGASDLCAAGIGAPHIRQRLYWVADVDRQHGDQSGPWTGDERKQQQAEESLLGVRAGGVAHTTLPESSRFRQQREHLHGSAGGGCNDSWRDFDIVHCRDGKIRRTQHGVHPLAHGVSGRMELIRGYGNAIVPGLAAEFVKAFQEIKADPVTSDK